MEKVCKLVKSKAKEMMVKNEKTLYRIDELEKHLNLLNSKLEMTYCRLDEKLDRIMENHLPHLQMELEALKTRVNVLFAINVGSVVLALLINKYF